MEVRFRYGRWTPLACLALRGKGMAALQYDGARGAELVNGAAYADELLRLYCA